MEGIIFELETLVSPWAVIGGVSLLAVGVALMLIGHASDGEKAGRRLYWAEWPVPGAEEATFEEEKFLRAA